MRKLLKVPTIVTGQEIVNDHDFIAWAKEHIAWDQNHFDCADLRCSTYEIVSLKGGEICPFCSNTLALVNTSTGSYYCVCIDCGKTGLAIGALSIRLQGELFPRLTQTVDRNVVHDAIFCPSIELVNGKLPRWSATFVAFWYLQYCQKLDTSDSYFVV